MSFLRDLKNFFRKDALESSPIAEINAGKPGEELPSGFFMSIGGESVAAGFYCPKCKYTVKAGAENGVVHCGLREYPPADADNLPTVRWTFPKNDGIVRLSNGSRIMDANDGGWDGDVQYEQGDPGKGGLF